MRNIDDFLFTQIRKRNFNGVKEAIELGANVNCLDEDGFYPIIKAASYNVADIVDLLLENGANANAVKHNSVISALLWAVEHGNFHIASSLIKAGADVNQTFNENWTPLLIAACYGDKDLVELLINNNADITAKNYENKNALDLAISFNNHETADVIRSYMLYNALSKLEHNDLTNVV